MENNEDIPDVCQRNEASLVKYRTVISPDSKYIICCCASYIKVFSVTSGECVHVLHGHKDTVTTVTLNPSNPFQIYSCSLDKTVIKWNYTDGLFIKKYQVGFPLYGLYVLQNNEAVAIAQKAKGDYEIVKFSICVKKIKNTTVTTLIKSVKSTQNCTDVGAQDVVLANVTDKKWTIVSLTNGQKYSVDEGNLMCVACHPQDHCVAMGRTQGKITIWWNVLSGNRTESTLHWHALMVRDLTFTPEGSYLLSGGHECVLVKWQLHNQGQKDTLPRLGAPITNLSCSPDGTMFTVALNDNSIQVVSSNFKVLQVIPGLIRSQFDESQEGVLSAGILVDPRTKALVLNGRPGHLQFYSTHENKELYNLDIVGENYVSPASFKKRLVLTQVERAAFNHTGQWLATVERRDDNINTPQLRVKFWLYNDSIKNYKLNTKVERAHEGRVLALEFRPPVIGTSGQPMAVTAADDGQFKLWSLLDTSDIHQEGECWNIESVGYYRSLPAHDAAFSEDGSLLGVVFVSTITLWDPDTNALSNTLSHTHPVRQVLFGRDSCSHLLVSTSEEKLTVWNLLSCSVLWTVCMPCSVMVQDPLSESMAVFSKTNELFVFTPSSPDVLFTMAGVTNSDVQAAVFVPHQKGTSYETGPLAWQKHSQLYYFNKNQELLVIMLEREKKQALRSCRLASAGIAQNLPETSFSRILNEQRKQAFKPETSQKYTGLLGLPGAQYLRDLQHTPAHVLPPVSSLCMTFMDSLMLDKKSSKKSSGAGGKGSASDSESDMEVGDQSDSDVEGTQSDSDVEENQSKTIQSKKGPSSSEQIVPPKDSNMQTVDITKKFHKANFSWTAKLF